MESDSRQGFSVRNSYFPLAPAESTLKRLTGVGIPWVRCSDRAKGRFEYVTAKKTWTCGYFRQGPREDQEILHRSRRPQDLGRIPGKFELVINLKTAKQIVVAIPRSVLFRADRVIKFK